MYVMGDIHGQHAKLIRTLRDVGLIDAALNWSGRDEMLWFLGDYFDRGPDGIAVIELIMSLQREAEATGGFVGALIGNHDVMALAAHQFSDRPSGGPGGTFRSSWLANGGNPADLERLETHHIQWLKSLPAMAVVDKRLLAHADATFYQVYGPGVAEVNQSISILLHGNDTRAWDQLLDYFSQRRAFQDGDMGRARVARFMATFGGVQFVHGHTPVCKLTGQNPESVIAPYIYAGGLAIDVDPGLYLGGPGFVVQLPKL